MYTEVQRKGFTLIELLVVIAIIALLAAVVALAINPVEILRRGRDSRRLSELEAMRKALDLTFADGALISDFSAPTGTSNSAEGCVPGPVNRDPGGTGWLDYTSTGWPTGVNLRNYLAVLPVDPSPCGTAITSQCTGATALTWQYRFVRAPVANPSGYVLMATMESLVNRPKCADDGGGATLWVEVGSDPGLCADNGADPNDAVCAN